MPNFFRVRKFQQHLEFVPVTLSHHFEKQVFCHRKIFSFTKDKKETGNELHSKSIVMKDFINVSPLG